VINLFLTLYELEGSFHERRRGPRKEGTVRGISTRLKGYLISSYLTYSHSASLLIYKLARNRKIPRPHIFSLGRLALGVVVPAGAVVPEGEGFEVAAPFADDVGVPAELEVELPALDEADPDGDVPAPVPGRTW